MRLYDMQKFHGIFKAFLVFAVVLTVSFVALNFYSNNAKAEVISLQSQPTITGTIVLLDDVKFTNVGGSALYLENIVAPVALPGSNIYNCSVTVTGCCVASTNNNLALSSISASAVGNQGCMSGSGMLEGGQIYTANMTCDTGITNAAAYLAVAYVCTPP
jgi:hypothetical protein